MPTAFDFVELKVGFVEGYLCCDALSFRSLSVVEGAK